MVSGLKHAIKGESRLEFFSRFDRLAVAFWRLLRKNRWQPQLQVGKRRRMSALIHAAGQPAVFGSERVNAVRGRPLRCSVADLFKKFSGSVQSSGRPPGLLWDAAKIIGSEA